MKNFINKIKKIIKTHPKFSETVFLIVIFSFSLIIRQIGLKNGFPLLTHPDEVAIIDPVLNMTRLHTLNSGNFNRPDQVLQYLNLGILNLISFIKYDQSVYSAFNNYYLEFYYYSRLMVSIMGSMLPIVAYKIGKEVQPKLAFPSALVFAFFPLFVNHSLNITPDVPITLFSLLVIYFALRYLNTGKEKYIIIATMFVAVNTAEKYPGLLSFTIILVAIGLLSLIKENNPHRFRTYFLRSAKMGLIFLVSLFIIAPYLFIEHSSVIEALIKESRSTHLGADNLGWLGNLWFYIQTFYSFVGWIGAVLFSVGLFALIKKFTLKNIVLLYGIFYWVALSKLALHWERWGLPMYITPLFIIAFGINYLYVVTKDKAFIFKFISGLFIIVFILQQSVYSVYIPVRKRFTDTRWVSMQYCQSVGITKANTIYEGNSPLRPKYSKSIFNEYTSQHPEKTYLILSSFMYNNFYKEPERYAEQIQIYNEIRSDNTLKKEFEPVPLARNTIDRLENIIYFIEFRLGLTNQIRLSGPTIKIYELID
jgi:hypothetical protein